MGRNKRRNKLLGYVLLTGGVMTSAYFVVDYVFRDRLAYYVTPTQLQDDKYLGRQIRLGGLVVENSIRTRPGTLQIEFEVTDFANEVRILYRGLLPEAFREGQSCVCQGVLDASRAFVANEILAKHDESYIPKEIAHVIYKNIERKEQKLAELEALTNALEKENHKEKNNEPLSTETILKKENEKVWGQFK